MALRRSFALLSLSSSSTVQAAACCRASTSTAHLLSPSQFLIQQSTSSFHSSAATHEKKRKLVARLKKKENLARRQKAREQLIATAPDPVRGYGPNNQDLWYKSELRKILLFPDEVYEGKAANLGMLDRLPKARDEVLGPVGVKSDDLIMKPPATSTSTTPSTYLSFGLSAEDEKLLLQDLPEADETIATANNTKGQKDGAQAAHKLAEEHKAEAARRILDLANANARGIRFENTRRIIRRFGQGEGTGRSEVVAALLTMRIHSMADHLQKMPRDIHSKRHITRLIMQRVKILRYLKRLDLQRYVQCLEDIGVEARAVEGAVQVKL